MVEFPKKSPVKYKKSTRGVHFTVLPASPCAADFYEIWHTRSTHRRNHMCQIFNRSVQGLRSSDTPKLLREREIALREREMLAQERRWETEMEMKRAEYDRMQKIDAEKVKEQNSLAARTKRFADSVKHVFVKMTDDPAELTVFFAGVENLYKKM